MCPLLPLTPVKATNERQDDGAGILHQVAQFSIDQIYFIFIQGAHAPLRPRKTQRDKVLAAKQVGLYVPLNRVYFIYIQGTHAPLRPCKTQRDKVLSAKQVGRYVPLKPPTPCSERQLKRVGGE